MDRANPLGCNIFQCEVSSLCIDYPFHTSARQETIKITT
jgi:hypothetical protein